MDERDFHRMILDEPDDDGLRLVFADWLEEHGQPDRAEWTRAGCARRGLGAVAPASGPAIGGGLDARQSGKLHLVEEAFLDLLVGREVDAWRRCKPGWWDAPPLPGVGDTSSRGLRDLEVRSRAAAARLGKAPWIREAIDGGWLGVIRLKKCDDAMIRAVASWKGPAREAPLAIEVVPQITDEGLSTCLGVPWLWSLGLPVHSLRNPSATRLGERADLRMLRLEVRNLDPDDVRRMLQAVARLDGLRQLRLEGRDFPTDDDLEFLGRMENLREIMLAGCAGLTDATLERIRTLPGLRLLTLLWCGQITAEGVTRLRQDRPSLTIQP